MRQGQEKKQVEVVWLRVAVTALTLVFSGCNLDLSPRYGVVKLGIPAGDTLYFIRQVSGQNFDELQITTNPNYCVDPDPEKDFIFNTVDSHEMYYKMESALLTLFVSARAKEPKRFPGKERIVQVEMQPSEWASLKEKYYERGLKHLEVPIVESKK
ncbi:MAG: hypothetical protein ACREDR_09540 [Blastocatellia bacterium]